MASGISPAPLLFDKGGEGWQPADLHPLGVPESKIEDLVSALLPYDGLHDQPIVVGVATDSKRLSSVQPTRSARRSLLPPSASNGRCLAPLSLGKICHKRCACDAVHGWKAYSVQAFFRSCFSDWIPRRHSGYRERQLKVNLSSDPPIHGGKASWPGGVAASSYGGGQAVC